jgi:hypothetical protein
MRSPNDCHQLTVIMTTNKPTARCTALLKKLKNSQPLQKFPPSTEPGSSLQCSYKRATEPYSYPHKPNKSNPHLPIRFVRFTSKVPSHLRLGLPSRPFLQVSDYSFVLYQLAVSRMCDRLHVHLLLHGRTQVTIFLIMRFSPYLCHFLAIRSTHYFSMKPTDILVSKFILVQNPTCFGQFHLDPARRLSSNLYNTCQCRMYSS